MNKSNSGNMAGASTVVSTVKKQQTKMNNFLPDDEESGRPSLVQQSIKSVKGFFKRAGEAFGNNQVDEMGRMH